MKREYVIMLQAKMTPFQRALVAEFMLSKAIQFNGGFAVNAGFDGGELDHDEMMDKKNHPARLNEEV
jgi:hypothetical protein